LETLKESMSDSSEIFDAAESAAGRRRVIKRYSNRKLYDTTDSKYVTLLELADLIRDGEDVRVIDNATKEDKTEVTLALIISEELKTQPRDIPLSALRSLIRERSGKWLSQLREGPIGKLMPKEAEVGAPEEPLKIDDRSADEVHGKDSPTKGIRATLEQWQNAIDERIRAIMPAGPSLIELQQELVRLSARVEVLEAALGDKCETEGTK
jgi:polyhydroxyalkanoate synthesis repressor PhaR